MKDAHNRVLDYLRISLTDRCNLRCSYCMPRCGVDNIPHDEILTFEEICRISRVMADLGVTKIRLTGGEPLVRKGFTDLVRALGEIPSLEEITLTTNGVLLAQNVKCLREYGVKRVNISLDTLDRQVFSRLTGSDDLDKVLDAIDTAYGCGMGIRINCVPVAGINDTELGAIAAIAKDRQIDVRFIELMPIGCGRAMRGIPSDSVLNTLEQRFGKAQECGRTDISSPAVYYSFEGFAGNIGLISPMTHKFCQYCNRLRLTADGYLKLCLQYPAGADLKTLLRQGISDKTLADIITDTIQKKPLAHSFAQQCEGDERKMVQIGG